MVRLAVRVPRLPLRSTRPWCNWQHDWFQPSWSGFESLGACLEDGSQKANPPPGIGLIVQQEDAGVACRLVSVQVRVGPLQCTNGPVAQRRGRLPYKETIGGSSPPRTTQAQIRQPAERPGSGTAAKRWSQVFAGSIPAPGTWLGRQLADHPDLESGMLWVRLPPGPLPTIRPRGAVWSARHAVNVEIAGSNPVEGAEMARYANPAERRISNVRGCGFDSLPCYLNMRRLGIGRPRWL